MIAVRRAFARPRLAVAMVVLVGTVLGSPAAAGPIESLAPGHWLEIPSSHLRSQVPVPAPPGDPAAIMAAWSGGAYDAVGDRLLISGGGHGDYSGNEVYAFSVNSLSWSRIWGPTPVDLILQHQCCGDAYPDGNPVSRHTYGGLEFLPQRNSFLLFGGFGWPAGGGGDDLWLLGLDTGAWRRKSDSPYFPGNGVASAYDPATGHVFLSDPAGYWVQEYDPDADTYTRRSPQGGGYGVTGVMDTKRRKLVFVGGLDASSGRVVVYDLTSVDANGFFLRRELNTTGATDVVGSPYPGLAYDPVSDRIVAWGGRPGDAANVYTLNLDTNVWTKHPPAPTNTVTPTPSAGTGAGRGSGGTFGRFRYMPSKNAFILVNHIDENVYVYKLAAGGGAPPDTTPPAAPGSLLAR